MVKYFAMAAALMGTLMIADLAQARGRRGCASCGGCPSGVCTVSMAAPEKMATTDSAPPGLATAPAPAPVATAVTPLPRYYASNTARRGLFGWRR
jgi:hypothetical protein